MQPQRGGAISADNAQPPEYVPGWQAFAEDGVLIGDSTAAVRVIEFADLECPFCGRFHEAFDQLKEHYGGNAALVFIHYPIATHRFAEPAARAAECAGVQGRFAEFIDAVFAKQDSWG